MMKTVVGLSFLAVVILGVAMTRFVHAAPTHNQSGTPILVELFTSEGCSSCPPADTLLQYLVLHQPVQGAHVIALEEHVDYWNHLGWRDKFSSQQFTSRQNDYSNTFGDNDVYTPEMVVNGRWGFVGSDTSQASQKIAAAAQDSGESAQIVLTRATSGISIKATLPSGLPASNLFYAITQDGLSSDVTAGENESRTLTHMATVRQLTDLATIQPGSTFDNTISYQATGGHEHVVAFVQAKASRRIVGVAELDLN